MATSSIDQRAIAFKQIDLAIDCIVDRLISGSKVLVFGCGGQAANAMHFEAELSGKYEQYEFVLPCICLGLNPCYVTAVANDFGWEYVYSRQIEALAKPGDVVVGFTISGEANYYRNVVKEALRQGCFFINIAGADGWEYPEAITIKTDTPKTPDVQEMQLKLVHSICEEVKQRMAR